jgi:hypothetical protein
VTARQDPPLLDMADLAGTHNPHFRFAMAAFLLPRECLTEALRNTGSRLSSPTGATEEEMVRDGDPLVTTPRYCGMPHRATDGLPLAHRCRVLPVEAAVLPACRPVTAGGKSPKFSAEGLTVTFGSAASLRNVFSSGSKTGNGLLGCCQQVRQPPQCPPWFGAGHSFTQAESEKARAQRLNVAYYGDRRSHREQ